MRLLKYPLELRSERLNALVSINNQLLLLSGGGHVIVWSERELVDTAFDKLSVSDLARKKIVPVEFKQKEEAFFLSGFENILFVGSEHQILKVRDWNENATRKTDELFHCKSPCTITDIKFDHKQKVLFVLCSNPNSILLFDAATSEKLSKIKLDKDIKPVTAITDPSGETFTVLCSDRSIRVYQFNKSGAHKLLNEMSQFVQVEPLHYKITMPPQADSLPIINSVKGTSSSTSVTATVLLDRNHEYKITNTVVSPASNSCKVLVFSPNVYKKINSKKGTNIQYNLLATSGINDGTILVWNSKRMKPLFNALQISETPINDMTWTDNGLTLFAISNDNILYTFAFQPVDLGETLSEEDVISLRKSNKQLTHLPDLKSKEEIDVKKLETDTIDVNTASAIDRKDNGSINSENFATKDSSVNNITSLVKKVGKNKNQVVKTLVSNPSVKVTQGSNMEFTPPSYTVPKDLKRRSKDDSNKARVTTAQKKLKRELEPLDFLETGLIIPNVSFSRIRLATPKIRLSFKYSSSTNSNFTMSVRNGSGDEQKPTIISLHSKTMEQDKQLFQDFIPKFITMFTSGKFFWACCSDDGIVYVYSDSGQRLLPPMIIGVPISFLEANGNYLLCVSSIGELYCWNIEEKNLQFPVNSVFPILNPSIRYSDDILTRAENITMCNVTNNGVPLLTLSNGDGYMFDKDMETWLLISDGWWAYGSQYWDTNNSSSVKNIQNQNDDKNDNFWNSADIQDMITDVRNDSKSIVSYLERKTNDELNRKGRIKNLQRFARAILMKEGFENMEEIVTLSHLENRLLVCLKLEESEEFSRLLVIYCVRLSELGYSDRLDDILQWLYNEGDFENASLGGKNRKELLKSVILACTHIRHVQRITNSYATAIGLLEETV